MNNIIYNALDIHKIEEIEDRLCFDLKSSPAYQRDLAHSRFNQFVEALENYMYLSYKKEPSTKEKALQDKKYIKKCLHSIFSDILKRSKNEDIKCFLIHGLNNDI